MQRTLLLFALTIASLFSFAQNEKLINDKNAEKRSVKGFHAIRISGGIDLYLTQGKDEAVAVSAASVSIRNKIRTEVEDGTLKIFMDNDGEHWGSGHVNMKAYVSFSTLDALSASGGSDVYVEEALKLEKLKIVLSGGSDMKGKVSIGELSITQSGGSDITLTGNASHLIVTASGGSDLHGYDLATETCNVSATGGSDVHILVNKELTATASGGSDVYYKGAASVKQVSSGSGSVSKKG